MTSFCKELSKTERKWNFIYIPSKYRELFPKGKSFKVYLKGESFEVSLNKAGRIVRKDLVKKLDRIERCVITVVKKSENEFRIDVLDEDIRKIVAP
jgi:hypothetical protein